jgi:hypothetical protein
MATSGPNYASTATDMGGPQSWTNLANAKANDGALASAVASTFAHPTNGLVWTGFANAVPSGATINGVVFEIGCSCPSSGVFFGLNLIKGGVPSGSDLSASTPVPTTLTNLSFGGATNLWGNSLTDADVNASNFGVQVWFAASGTRTISVDYGRLTIYYTPSGGGGGFQAALASRPVIIGGGVY